VVSCILKGIAIIRLLLLRTGCTERNEVFKFHIIIDQFSRSR